MQEISEQPRPVQPLEYCATAESRPDLVSVRIFTVITLIVGVIGWLVMLFITESVLISGPILLLSSSAFLVYALRLKQARLIVLAGIHVGICLTFFCFVQMFHWGPSDARVPFDIVGTLYAIAAILLSIKVLRRRSHY